MLRLQTKTIEEVCTNRFIFFTEPEASVDPLSLEEQIWDKFNGTNTTETIVNISRLDPSLEWSRGLKESLVSGKTGKLFIESHSGVFILGTAAVIAAVIGHSDFFKLRSHHVNAFTSLGCIDELRSDQYLWRSTSPDFGGSGSDFASVRVHTRD